MGDMRASLVLAAVALLAVAAAVGAAPVGRTLTVAMPAPCETPALSFLCWSLSLSLVRVCSGPFPLRVWLFSLFATMRKNKEAERERELRESSSENGVTNFVRLSSVPLPSVCSLTLVRARA